VSLILFAVLGTVFMAMDPAWGLALTSLLVALAPTVVASLWSPRGWRRSLNLVKLPLASAGWILLAAPAAFLVAGQLAAIQAHFFPIPADYLSQFEAILKQVNAHGPMVGIAVVAVLPALCEEPLFRGLLLSAILPRLAAGWACLMVGLLFAVFHLDPYRLASTAFLGAFLALLVVRTGSLLASILAHLLNNLAAELVLISGLLPEETAYGTGRLLPWPLVVLAALIVTACLTRLRPRVRELAIPGEP
jgi:membrane protease YdiL (CAAX protease family)